MHALLDTSVIIALTQEHTQIDGSVFDTVSIASLSYAELQLGVAVAGSRSTMRRRALALDSVRDIFGAGLPFDDRAATVFGRFATAIIERKGDPKANRTDRMIAAVAAAHDLALVTLNARDVALLDREMQIIDASTMSGSAPPPTSP
ncbi:PIN domain-containing protein [Agromyces archimandritae]|uniref:PIN domain-containing protein n=1 Tax=Agromyces archimandritae TaxID=2781962 RepID=A0A975FPP4_9MICO|nr:PIN domain-containing protein [Agromyces archimandritae]QTX06009.1 hypothetical protein G127AT_07465 [Agromyces archimandritae]